MLRSPLNRQPIERPSSVVVAFPMERAVGKARHVAATYQRRTTARSRDRYWLDTCETMATMLRRCGLDEEQVNRQLSAFARAVSSELALLSGAGGHDE